ncbi:hypothetical protein [Geminisphaera colitermitum]|uniref:hypothetical protein n=1 Tax=Geminisphaera colitermitum TaxID=1148786 RepID=UPI001E56DE82|nr:hypothetical protein [Geminisphaera colitermitum]
MRVEIEESFFFALEKADKLHQRRVLEHIGEVSRVELVAVIHRSFLTANGRE